MVDFKKLGDKAKDLIDKRGGADTVKEDAAELKDIATGRGSLADKAKAAAGALKDPGAEGGREAPDAADRRAKPEPSEPADEGGVADARAERRERRAARRKQRATDGGSGSGPA